MKHAELAQLIGVSGQVFSHWITGRNEPKLDDIIRIAKALNVSLDWLTGLSDEKPSSNPPLTPRERDLLDILRAVSTDLRGTAEKVRRPMGGAVPKGIKESGPRGKPIPSQKVGSE